MISALQFLATCASGRQRMKTNYCRDQNCSGSGNMFPGVNLLKVVGFIAG